MVYCRIASIIWKDKKKLKSSILERKNVCISIESIYFYIQKSILK